MNAVVWAIEPFSLFAQSNNPGSGTLLSLRPHSAEGFHPDVQQSRTGRYTWRHQWQFFSLQNMQKASKAL